MKETELAEKFIDFFGDKNDIFKEVPFGGFIDIVIKSGNILTSVEVKTNLNFDVIEQAERNKMCSHYSYIGVPNPKKKIHFGYKICQMLGIGVLVYDNKYKNHEFIRERIQPKLNRKIIKPRLLDYMKLSPAGTVTDRITPFKITIENMIDYIKRHPKCKLQECLSNIDFHWSNMTSAKGSVYQWMRNGVIKDFYIDNGKLYLTDETKRNI